jgi:hypothetical protein
VEEVRAEVERYAENFLAIYFEGDESYREMTLREMLDAAEVIGRKRGALCPSAAVVSTDTNGPCVGTHWQPL